MLKDIFKNQLHRIKTFFLHDIIRSADSTLMLLGKNASHRMHHLDQIDSLKDVEFKVFSQWGEDGIIEWLVHKIPIASRRFIEFGVENYKEANTRFLIKNRNWKGLIIDSNEKYMQQIRNDEISWRHDLTSINAFITRENINSLIADNGFTGKVGILSIDIDGNDYWVWEALEVADPDLVICEYNAVFGDIYPIVLPYEEGFNRTVAHYSNLYCGCSIRALEWLAARKGYGLVGSNSAGNNAFFVRNDLFAKIDQCILNKKAKASLFRESYNMQHELSFLGGLQRFELIKHLPVIRIDTGEKIPLGSLSPVYSSQWLGEMDANNPIISAPPNIE